MKAKVGFILVVIIGTVMTAGTVMAQQPGVPEGQGGRGGQGQHYPKPPLVTALDANGDGIIDASEIANAASALKALDKNGDGKLTPDEYRPPRLEGQGGANGPTSGPEGIRKP